MHMRALSQDGILLHESPDLRYYMYMYIALIRPHARSRGRGERRDSRTANSEHRRGVTGGRCACKHLSHHPSCACRLAGGRAGCAAGVPRSVWTRQGCTFGWFGASWVLQTVLHAWVVRSRGCTQHLSGEDDAMCWAVQQWRCPWASAR